MKLKKRFLRLIILLVSCSMLVTGCDFEANESNNACTDSSSCIDNPIPLEYGFEFSSGEDEAIRIFFCAYRSPTNVFDIDNITLDFYYGVDYHPYSPEYIQEILYSYPYFEVAFKSEGEEKVIIKTVEENFISEKYNCEVVYTEDRMDIKRVIFNHHETFTIPKEVFTKETGIIYFSVYGTNVCKDPPSFEWIVGRPIHYKVADNKVCLSNKRFN